MSTPTIGQAVVAPSGKSIVLLPQDGTGTSTNITSIASSSEVQSIQLVGTPSGNAFTLSFNGQATAPIATTISPPAIYFLWTVPTSVGHSYNLAVSYSGIANNYFGQYSSAAALGYEILESGVVVNTYIVNSNAEQHLFQDGEFQDSNPAYWSPVIASPITATATTIQIRCTGTSELGIRMSDLRVDDVTASAITYYSVSQSENVTVVPSDFWASVTAVTESYGGYELNCATAASGIGPFNTITPGESTSALVLQGALQALSSIGAGGVIVTDLSLSIPLGFQGYVQGTYKSTFAGSLAGTPQSLITCSDSAVSIVEVTAGGNAPTLSINAGGPIILGNWVWGETSPGLPYAFCPLFQSAPDVQTFTVNRIPYAVSGSWDGTFVDDSSLSSGPVFGWSSGLTMSFACTELPAGTYQFAATYPNTPFTQNGVTYHPSTATQFLIRDGNGDTVGGPYTVDQTQAPSDYQATGNGDGIVSSVDRGWKIIGSVTLATQGTLTPVMTTVGQSAAVGDNPQVVAVLDAIQLNRTSSDLSVVIGPDDVTTIDIPANWMTTQAGAIPAISNLSVSPPSPTAIMPPFVANQKTTKIGYNVEPYYQYSTMISHSNLAYLIQTMGSVQDANGYPTRFVSPFFSAGQITYPIISPTAQIALADPPQGTYLINPGLFVMTWDGDAAITLYQGFEPGVTVTEVVEDQILTGTTGNKRVFNVQFDPIQIARPVLSLQLISDTQDLELDPSGNTYVIHLTNLKIYPPDPSDPTGNTIWVDPPKFHPWFLYKLQGMQTIRTMDVMATNSNSTSLLAHYKPETYANRISWSFNSPTAVISLIQQAPSDVIYFTNFTGPVLQVTTATPHGLYDGCLVEFVGCGTPEFINSQTIDLATTAALIHVLDDTNVICAVASFGVFFPTAMSNTLTGGALVAPFVGTTWSLQDIIDLINAVPTITDLHFNMSLVIDTTAGPGGGAYDVAAFLATNLKSGIKVHMEVGNECWNVGTNCWNWCALQTARLTDTTYSTDFVTFFAAQTKAVHDQCLSAFTAAGRPEDMIHLYGVFTGQPAVTTNILALTQASGATVDEVCVALYFDSWPFVGYAADQLPIFHAMIPDQLLDYMELNAVYGQYPELFVANQYTALVAGGYPNAKVIAYEGSVDTLVPVDPIQDSGNPPGSTPNFSVRQQTVRRHPRMYGVVLQMCQGFQDAGLTMWNYFHIGGAGSYHCWDCYESGNQQRGTGTSADTINVTNPLAKNLVLNQEGGALYQWATLVGQPYAVPIRWIRAFRQFRVV